MDRKTSVALLVAATTFMEILDATIITTALPHIAADFDVAAAHLSVGVSAYLVALTVFIPLSGWLTHRLGTRTIFCTAIFIFSLSSLLCAFSQTLTEFTFARILQGIGGAMMVPVGRLIVLQNLPKDKIVKAVAILTWPALTAPLVGPLLGGWIATYWSWPWIFLINLPLGLLALVAALWLVTDNHKQSGKFDIKGFFYCGVGFGSFMAGLELLSQSEGDHALPLVLLIIGLSVLTYTYRYLSVTSSPLFSLSAMNVQTFRVTAIGGSITRSTISAVPFLLPLMFQIGFGYSAVKAGGLLLWLFAGNLLMKTSTTFIMNQFGFRKVMLINGAMIAIGFAAIAMFTVDTPYWLVAVILFISGANRSMQFTAINTLSFSDIEPEQMRDANTLSAVLHNMTQGLGIAIGALALSTCVMLLGGTMDSPPVAAFQGSFILLSIIALLSLADTLSLPHSAGHSILTKKC